MLWKMTSPSVSENELINTSRKRQRTTESSGNTDREKKGVAVLLNLDAFSCTCCSEHLTGYIYQCANGHAVCLKCCHKMSEICSTCHMLTLYRNRAVEGVLEVVRVPCPNAEFGCSEYLPYDDVLDERSAHLERCLFTQCPCPFRSCEFTGSYKELYEHSASKHLESLKMFKCGKILTISLASDDRVVLKEMSTEGGELVVMELITTPEKQDKAFSLELFPLRFSLLRLCFPAEIIITPEKQEKPQGKTHEPMRNQNGEEKSRKRKDKEVETQLVLPFTKKSPVWKIYESMEVFKGAAQTPHFSPLIKKKEDFREGSALGKMETFALLLEKLKDLETDVPISKLDSLKESFLILEKYGFKITWPLSRINKLLFVKMRKADEEIDEIEVKIFELERRRVVRKEEKELAYEKICELESCARDVGVKLKDVETELES